uniref:Uncharacterized protein n=1 Tax=viral metagenome TaxID=1070528 RepID=A0A6M3L7C7_9ZZZZ
MSDRDLADFTGRSLNDASGRGLNDTSGRGLADASGRDESDFIANQPFPWSFPHKFTDTMPRCLANIE